MSATARSWRSPSGTRPRFVWISTPVALITGRSNERSRSASILRAASMTSASVSACPARIRSRASSIARRAASVTTAGGPISDSSAASRSTFGSDRRRDSLPPGAIRALPVEVQQAPAHRLLDRGYAVVHVELRVDVGDVSGDRSLGDLQPARDRLVREPVAHQAEDLALTRRQRLVDL